MKVLTNEFHFNEKYSDPKKSLIGIEVEAENYITEANDPLLTCWAAISDSSLKNNGVEFVSHVIDKESAREALNQLFQNRSSFKQRYASFGPRTSIHIHTNACWMKTGQDVTNLIFFYLLVEDLMYEFVARHRRKNIFCVKTKETQYLKNVYNAGTISNNNSFKYAGMNLQSLFTHGTVEFRQLEGTYDVDKIVQWIEFVDQIQNYAKLGLSGLDFRHEVKNPTIALEYIFQTFGKFYQEKDIMASVEKGLEYFRYLVCTQMPNKIFNKFIAEDFFTSKFYTANFVRKLGKNKAV